jgi:uncharacterized protein
VTDLADLPALSAALTDYRFFAALVVAALSGFVRGFSGFGSALIYIPLVAAIYEPRIAAPTLLLIDLAGSAPFTIRELWRCNWREVAPTTIAAALCVPLGVMALVLIDPIVLRWFIAFLVLTLLAVLVSGWRYHAKPTLPVSIGVGLFAGFGSGAVQIAGPAVIIFWLMDFITGAAYVAKGIITLDILTLSVLLGIPFILAMWAGARWFHGASDAAYRRAAYAIIALSALASLPLWDGWVR